METIPKKKIMFVITKSNWGGAQKYVYDKAISSDADVTVILGGNGILKEKLEKKGIRVIQVKNLGKNISLSKDLSVLKKLINIFKEESPETIHLNSSKIGVIGTIAGRIAKVPKIKYTAHGWVFNEDIKPLKRLTLKKLSWLTIILSHETIVLSEFEAKQVSKWPFCKNKITIQKTELPPINFSNQGDARSYLQIPQDKIVIGTVAELHKNKGLEYGVRAMSKLKNKNIIWVIIGEGEERKNIEKLIKKHNLQKTVSLKGHIENAAEHMRAFNVFMLPSVKEGLPYVLLEAQQAGVSIIATKVGGIPEYFAEETLVKPKDATALSNAIKSKFQ